MEGHDEFSLSLSCFDEPLFELGESGLDSFDGWEVGRVSTIPSSVRIYRILISCALVAVGILCFGGCSTVSDTKSTSTLDMAYRPIQPHGSVPVGDRGSAGHPSSVLESPFDLQIMDVKNDGYWLYLFGELSARTDWLADDVTLRLSTFQGEVEVGTEWYPLSELRLGEARGGNWHLEQGKRYPFSVMTSVEGVTDYRLALLWGMERAEDTPGALALSNHRTSHRVVECDQEVCLVEFEVRATLSNRGDRTVYTPLLEVSYRSRVDLFGDTGGAAESRGAGGLLDLFPSITQDGWFQHDGKVFSPEIEEIHPGGAREVDLVVEEWLPRALVDRLHGVESIGLDATGEGEQPGSGIDSRRGIDLRDIVVFLRVQDSPAMIGSSSDAKVQAGALQGEPAVTGSAVHGAVAHASDGSGEVGWKSWSPSVVR